MATVTPVVIAMVGKLLVSGRATEKTSCLRPVLKTGPGSESTTAPMAVTAKTSGGWTMGPNRLRRRTAHTAMRQPRM